MKFLAALCLALCLFVVACHGVPVERETLLSIEKAQPVAVVVAEGQPQELRRVARGFGGGFGGGYPGFGGLGGYGGYPGYGGYGGFPAYGGYGGGYPIGGFGGGSSSAVASASSGSGYQFYG